MRSFGCRSDWDTRLPPNFQACLFGGRRTNVIAEGTVAKNTARLLTEKHLKSIELLLFLTFAKHDDRHFTFELHGRRYVILAFDLQQSQVILSSRRPV